MLDIKEIENIRKYMVNALIRSKMFDKYRYNGAFQLVVDATGVSSHNYNFNGNCTSRTTKNKKGEKTTTYYKNVLEAKIVVGKIVISLDTEWIENTEINNEKQKQDCEVNAFKRMAPRIKKNYPKLKFIISGDALYATTPMINICKDNKWNYIFNLKKDRLKLTGYSIDNTTLLEEFDDSYNKSEVIKSMATTSTGTFNHYAKVLGNSDLKKIETIVDNKINECINNIKDANFDINPKVIDKDNRGCKFCMFSDVCYVEAKDKVVLEEKSLDKILEEVE